MTENKEHQNTVEVCTVSGIRKNDRLENFQKEKSEPSYPFADYFSKEYPDKCKGNCEQCKTWELRTEKELYVKENDTFLNHFQYNAGYLLAYFCLLLPVMIVVGYAINHDVRTGIFLSLLFALVIHWLVHDRTDRSFKKWLEEKYETKR